MEIGRIRFKASLGKSYQNPHLNKHLCMVAYFCNPWYVGSIGKRIVV
jgi:hypothetical protein